MVPRSLSLLIASTILVSSAAAAPPVDQPRSLSAVAPGASWPVTTSLKVTLRNWAQREGWPPPQFLTDADWPVDVPGAIPGSIESALKLLAEGFGRAPNRPRIELSGNHVIVVSEYGAE